MNKSIFDIQHEYLMALDDLENYCLENDTDEVPDHIQERLSINKDELGEKLENYRLYLTELDSKIEALDFEAKRMIDKRKRFEKAKERIKGYMQVAVKTFGESTKTSSLRVKTDRFNFSFIPVAKVNIEDEDLVPDRFAYTRIDLPDLSLAQGKMILSMLLEVLPSGSIKQQRQINKKAVAESLKNLEEVPGAELDKENGYIRIS